MLPLFPPKLNPGHGHQIVADPEEENKPTPGYSLMGLFNKINSVSPTQSPSVGGNYFLISALKPSIYTHINLQYNSSTLCIFSSPCLYHLSKNITNHISHNNIPILQTGPLVSRALARLNLPILLPPASPESCDTCEPIKGPGFPSRANM